MLTDLFQSSDSIYFMFQGANKLPIAGFHATLAESIDEVPHYFSINPICNAQNRNTKAKKHPRASINVTAFRNFLFELDSTPLDVQENLLRFIQPRIPIAQVTYSGSNSLHAIISVADTLPFKVHTETGIAEYSQAWKALDAELRFIASEFFSSKIEKLFDTQCKDPARLSRTPGAIRPDTLKLQNSLEGFGGLIGSDFVLHLMNKHSETPKYLPTEIALPDSPDEKGQPTKRTMDFINNWKPELASIWAWHPELIFAVKDLQAQNYTFDEAYKLLESITGHLDSNDEYQMQDVWSRSDFSLTFRKRKV